MADRKPKKPSAKSPRPSSVFDDPPRKNVFLLCCMDQRLLDDIVRFMNSLNLQNRYDQLALAGGAMGALQLPRPDAPDPERWRQVFFIHLREAINTLHRPIKDIFLLEHLDCGAYKYLHPDTDVQEQYRDADRDGMTVLHHHELVNFAAEVRDFIDEQRRSAKKELKAAREACEKCKNDEQDKEQKMCWDHVKEAAKEKGSSWIFVGRSS